MKGLKAEVAEEEVSFKKAGRAVEVLSTQQKALEERLTELERERKEVGSSMDAAHLKKLETQVKAFEKGLGRGGREGGREGREGGLREGRGEEGREGGRGRGKNLHVFLYHSTEHTKAAERAGQVESEVKRYTTDNKQLIIINMSLFLHPVTPTCSLHEEIMEVGGARLKPQQAMVDKLIKEIDDANGVITKARVGIKTNERYGRTC